AVGIIISTLVMYFALLAIQIGRHKHFFDEPRNPGTAKPEPTGGVPASQAEKGQVTRLTILLFVSVIPVLLMGKYLTTLLDFGSSKLGTPPAFGGIILALIVISPKIISSIKAGYENQPQRAVNLALGSCAPAMGVIFPIILGIGMATGKTVIMGAY